MQIKKLKRTKSPWILPRLLLVECRKCSSENLGKYPNNTSPGNCAALKCMPSPEVSLQTKGIKSLINLLSISVITKLHHFSNI